MDDLLIASMARENPGLVVEHDVPPVHADDEPPVVLRPGGMVPFVPVTGQSVLLDVISRVAGDPTVDLDRVERLLQMHERLVGRDAERQFTEAMARFKADPPKIIKDKLVSYATRDEGQVQYRHATIGAVCDAVIGGLARVGISHSWELDQGDGKVKVTCVLTHSAGHSQRRTLIGAPDASGKKNAIQQTASTITYLERYTLLAAVGLATDEADDDGGSAGMPPTAAEAPPQGFDSWKADMDAVGDHESLLKAWKGSNPIYRAYVTLYHADWWEKRKAVLVPT